MRGAKAADQTARDSGLAGVAGPDDSAPIPRGLWRNVAHTLEMAWAATPLGVVISAVLVAVSSLVPTATAWLGKVFVDGVIGARAGLDGRLAVIAVVFGLLAGVQRSLSQFQSRYQTIFSRRVELAAERKFIERVSRTDMGYFDDPAWHDKVARATRDVSFRPAQLTQAVIGLFGSVVGALGSFVLLFAINRLLLVLAVASVVPIFVAQRRVNRLLYSLAYKWTAEERERNYLRFILTDSRVAKELRAFDLAEHVLERYDDTRQKLFRRLVAAYSQAGRIGVVSGLAFGCVVAAAYWFVARIGVVGGVTAGAITAIIAAFGNLTSQIAGVSLGFVQVDEHAAFLDDYFSFLRLPPLIPVPDSPEVLPERLRGGIELTDVTFSYPGSEIPALDGLSLKIEPGEVVALVGDNGAGKTTLVKLLCRFYDPASGSVRFDGVDLIRVDPTEVRSHIGVLFQDFMAYATTLRDNIAFGRPSKDPSDDAVNAALTAARADSLLAGLKGLDSTVGRMFEGGKDLSGGEWQRLAIARLMFRDADIWILDEPTSSLDAETEAAIFADLKRYLDGRIGILISHRFSTVRVADRIAVVTAGKIAELGTHDELVALNGRYAHLFRLQASAYQ